MLMAKGQRLMRLSNCNASIEWKSVAEGLPEQQRALYLVVIGDQAAFAWYEQNGNGEWGFNKNDVHHWAQIPEVPKDATKKVPMAMEP